MISSVSQLQNPYIIGPPVRNQAMFFGREELFRFIADNLRKEARVILLYGQRRIGKSSVLRMIPEFVRLEPFFFFRFDLQDQARLPVGRVLHNLATELVERLNETRAGQVASPSLGQLERDPNRFASDFLPQVYQALGERNLVLLIDEFDVLNTYNGEAASAHLFPYLQAVIHRQPRLYLVPVVGRQLEEIPALLSLFHEAPRAEIGLLDEQNARQLMTRPVQGTLTYTEEATEAIYKLTSGHPYFTQLVCYELFDHLLGAGRATIERGDVEAVVDKALIHGESGLAWFRDGLRIPERVFFSAVAEMKERYGNSLRLDIPESKPLTRGPWQALENHGVVKTDRLINAEETLIKWGFLRKVREMNWEGGSLQLYEVAIEIVRRWLLKRHPLAQAVQELGLADDKCTREAAELYQKAEMAAGSGKDARAIAIYKDALEADPNYFPALFKLAEAQLEAGEFGEAVSLYQRAYRVDRARNEEGLIAALMGAARRRLQQGKTKQAQEYLDRALAIRPNHKLAGQLLGETRAAARRALAARNPFTIGMPVPPAEFVGRKRETGAIFSALGQGGHIAICGLPGLGKSSLLRYMASPEAWSEHGLEPATSLTLYVNCQNLRPFTPTGFWQEVLALLRDKVEDKQGLLSSLEEIIRAGAVEKKALRQALRQIGRRGLSLVLLLDDYDVALCTNESYTEEQMLNFLSEFRALAVHTDESQYLSSVVAASRPLYELGPALSPDSSPWYNHYLFQLLKPFDEEEVQALRAKFPEELTASDEELGWARRMAGNYPSLLQMAFSILYRANAAGSTFDLERATEELTTISAPFFQTLWEELSEPERMRCMLTAIVEVGEGAGRHFFDDLEIIFSQLTARDLFDQGLLVLSAGQRPRLFSPLMTDWLIRQTEQVPADELDEQFKKFLNRR